MVHVNNKSISGIYRGQQNIYRVYKGPYLVWDSLLSVLCCFANGYWADQYPWVDNSSWKDNN